MNARMSGTTAVANCVIILVSSIVIAPSCARAALTVVDNFNFSPVGSDLNSQSGGGSSGFSDAWSGNTSFNIGDGSLVSPVGMLPSIGNSMTTVAYFENRGIDRPLTSALGTPGTSAYVSFLMRPEGILHQGAFNGWFGLALRGSATVVVGMSSFGDNYTLEISGATDQTNKAAVVGETVFFVLRMDFTEGVTPTRLYVNPRPGPEPAIADAILLNNGILSLTGISLTGPGSFSFDTLRIGTTYADVMAVPEPSCIYLAIIAFACRCTFMRQRRLV
jgi:hypothetical protein